MAFTHERTVIKPLGFASWFTTLLSRVAHIKKKKGGEGEPGYEATVCA